MFDSGCSGSEGEFKGDFLRDINFSMWKRGGTWNRQDSQVQHGGTGGSDCLCGSGD